MVVAVLRVVGVASAPMHYSVLFEAAALLGSLSPEDRDLILSKPASTDRAADMAWRRLCRRHGIVTTARCVTERGDYQEVYRLRRRVADLERELQVKDRDESQRRLAAALRKVQEQRG